MGELLKENLVQICLIIYLLGIATYFLLECCGILIIIAWFYEILCFRCFYHTTLSVHMSPALPGKNK